MNSNVKQSNTVIVRFTHVERGAKWPSGDFELIAELPISHVELASALSAELNEGIEVGLGKWCGVGGVLNSGAAVEFIHYHEAPMRGVLVRVDKAHVSMEAFEEVLAILGLAHSQATWVAEALNA